MFELFLRYMIILRSSKREAKWHFAENDGANGAILLFYFIIYEFYECVCVKSRWIIN